MDQRVPITKVKVTESGTEKIKDQTLTMVYLVLSTRRRYLSPGYKTCQLTLHSRDVMKDSSVASFSIGGVSFPPHYPSSYFRMTSAATIKSVLHYSRLTFSDSNPLKIDSGRWLFSSYAEK